MSVHTFTHSQNCYNQIEQNPNRTAASNLWTGYYLLLTVIVGAETLVMFAVLHAYSRDLNETRDFLHQDLFPSACLHQGVDPGVARCNHLIQDLLNSAKKRLLLGVHDSLWRNLQEHNVTQIFRAAIHVGARPDLNQYWNLQPTGAVQADLPAWERLSWESLGVPSAQMGPMGLSPDRAELLVPETGIYFVYSQVQSETPRTGFDRFSHRLMMRRAPRPEPTVLAKAAAGRARLGRSLYSSHQGALFQLEKGDRLSLFVSDMGAVRFFPDSTYFGAFRID